MIQGVTVPPLEHRVLGMVEAWILRLGQTRLVSTCAPDAGWLLPGSWAFRPVRTGA